MPRARFQVEGLKEAVERVDDVGERARQPEPALRSDVVLGYLMAGEGRKFRRGGWQKDTPAWVARKRARGWQTRTLVKTGRLEDALVRLGPKGHNDILFRAWNGELTWGIRPGRSDLYYSQALAKGVRGRRPSRMVLIDKETKQLIAAHVQKYIATGEGAAT